MIGPYVSLTYHSKIKIPSRSKNSTHVFHQYTLQIIGYDRFADILVAEFYPNLEYNVSQNNAEKIKLLRSGMNVEVDVHVK